LSRIFCFVSSSFKPSSSDIERRKMTREMGALCRRECQKMAGEEAERSMEERKGKEREGQNAHPELIRRNPFRQLRHTHSHFLLPLHHSRTALLTSSSTRIVGRPLPPRVLRETRDVGRLFDFDFGHGGGNAPVSRDGAEREVDFEELCRGGKVSQGKGRKEIEGRTVPGSTERSHRRSEDGEAESTGGIVGERSTLGTEEISDPAKKRE
jgi:hypothetical protein